MKNNVLSLRNLFSFIFILTHLVVNTCMASEVLVVGTDFNAMSKIRNSLVLSGNRVTQRFSPILPADLSPFDSVWYVEILNAKTADDQTKLINFIKSGKEVYFTSEDFNHL